MLNSSIAVQQALVTNSSITALVAEISSLSYPAIFNDNPIPSDYQSLFPSINHYRTGQQSATQEWTDMTYVANCWGRTLGDAETLQQAVAVQLGDTYDDDGFYFLTNILPTIPMEEEGGIYNSPVEIRVRKNSRIGD